MSIFAGGGRGASFRRVDPYREFETGFRRLLFGCAGGGRGWKKMRGGGEKEEEKGMGGAIRRIGRLAIFE
jgi:hypothetical protein